MDEKTKQYMRARARPGQRKTVTFKVTKDKNYGLKETQSLRAGFCPCSVCGHKYMWECFESNCQCCSSACT